LVIGTQLPFCSLARQLCQQPHPAALPGSLTWQPCPAALLCSLTALPGILIRHLGSLLACSSARKTLEGTVSSGIQVGTKSIKTGSKSGFKIIDLRS
jgi:hypothetical protein